MKYDEFLKLHPIGGGLNTKKRKDDEEHRIQCACVRWFRYEYPEYKCLLYAVPNGGRRDQMSMDALKAEIEQEIERLNKAYPRTKPFVFSVFGTVSSGQCMAHVEGNDDKVVFYMTWLVVIGIYRYNEKTLPPPTPGI